jgi:O-antigen ligase
MPWFLGFYMWMYLHRPFEFWGFLGTIQIERITMGFVLIYWFLQGRKNWLPNRLIGFYFLFVLAILLCWLASPCKPDWGDKVWDDTWKVGVFAMLILTSIRGEKELRQILVAYFVALTLYQSHSLLEFICGRHEFRQGIVRMIGVDDTFGDPNTFSATILYSMPLLLPFWNDPPDRRRRGLIVGYVALNMICILLTGSRRAYLGIVFLAFLLAMVSSRRFQFLTLGFLLSPLLFFLMPEDLRMRFLTVFDPSLGPKVAADSANFRYKAVEISLQLIGQSPLFGIGPGAFQEASGVDLQPHNLYAQLIGEMGMIGIIAFTGILVGFFVNTFEMRRLYRRHPWWEHDFNYRVVNAIFLAVILLLFMGLGGHNLYRYNWMWFGVMQAVALHAARQRRGELPPLVEYVEVTEPEPPPRRVGYRWAM